MSDEPHSLTEPPFRVTFWGVRGSVPTPGPSTLRYGGNTSCVEVTCGQHELIFDAGTGITALGGTLVGNGTVRRDLFLTHTHLDHVIGLPFFAPIYDPKNEINIWAGHLETEGIGDILRRIMSTPLMPVPLEAMQAARNLVDFTAGDVLQPKPGVVLRTVPLHHPELAVGYRIEYAGKSLCYITDVEHGNAALDRRLEDFVRGTDILIYDATYTDEEYHNGKVGWGHSTWQRAVALADTADVGTCVLFHHAPEHDDAMMDTIGMQAAAARPGTLVAREGMILDLLA